MLEVQDAGGTEEGLELVVGVPEMGEKQRPK